jgi:hypothetical protein
MSRGRRSTASIWVSEGATARSGSELDSVPGSPWGQVIFNRVVTAGTAVFSNASPPKHLIDRRRDRPAGHVHHYAAGVGDGEEERFNRVWVTSAHRTHARASTSSGQSASSTTPCERTSHKDVTA